MNKAQMDDLIDALSTELEPVKRLGHPFFRGLNMIILSLLYVGAIAGYLGFRPDLNAVLSEQSFIFEQILMIGIFVSAAFASAWLCVPDMRGLRWIIPLPLILLAVFVIWLATEIYISGFTVPHIHWHHCAMDAALIVTIPASIAVFTVIRGATTKPAITAFMAMLTITALGYTTLRFTCMSDAMGHIAFYHILPFVFGGGIIGATTQRFLRW